MKHQWVPGKHVPWRARTFLAVISLLLRLGACSDTNLEEDVLILSDKTVNSTIKSAGQSLLLVSNLLCL